MYMAVPILALVLLGLAAIYGWVQCVLNLKRTKMIKAHEMRNIAKEALEPVNEANLEEALLEAAHGGQFHLKYFCKQSDFLESYLKEHGYQAKFVPNHAPGYEHKEHYYISWE